MLAERVGAPGQNTIARVMQDLLRNDIILGLPAGDSRETLYRVTDRVFVHFYRLRQGNALALKTPLATILEFLRAFYSRDEQKAQAIKHLTDGRPDEARLFADLAREGEAISFGLNWYFYFFAHRLQRYLTAANEVLPLKTADIVAQLNSCPEQLLTDIKHWELPSAMRQTLIAIIAAQALAKLGLVEQADERLTQQQATSLAPTAQVMLHHERGILLLNMTSKHSLVIKEYQALEELRLAELPITLRAIAYRDFAWLLGQLNRHDEAIASAKEAANVAAQIGEIAEQATALRHVTWSLGELNRHDEAIASAKEAANLAAQAGDIAGQATVLHYAAWSLGRLKRYDEAIASAKEAASLAAQVSDIAEQAGALGIAAYSLNQLQRYQEALTEALASFTLARQIADMWYIKQSAKQAVLAAMHIPSIEAITAYAYWVEQDRKQTSDSEEPDWRYWIAEAFAASARARYWLVLDEIFTTSAESLTEEYYFSTTKIGLAIALRGKHEGRADGFAAMREALPRLRQFWQANIASGDLQNDHLTALTSGFAEYCDDPGLLRDVAGLLNADLTSKAPKLASLLLVLAQFDEAKNPQAVLARMDPDMALWLKRFRKLPELSEKSKRRKK